MISTSNEVIKRKTRDLPAIVCEQKSAPKVKVQEKLLRKANKCGFGDDIGTITNRVTAMFDVLAKYEVGSDEYNELMYRIMCGQAYQQEAIDKVKGIEAKKMPESWFNYRVNKIKADDDLDIVKIKMKNIDLMANKKPYFFIYNYEHLMNEYNTFMQDVNKNSITRFGVTYNELKKEELKNLKIDDLEIELENTKGKDERKNIKEIIKKINFLNSEANHNPVFYTPSTMNRIAWYIEEEFKDVKLKISKNNDFDINILKSKRKYNISIQKKLKTLYKEYKKHQRQYMEREGRTDEQCARVKCREMFLEKFKRQALVICPNLEELCNALIDTFYNSNEKKQFVWDIVGEQIIENLLNKNGRKYSYPVKDKNGDIEWKGYKFKMKEEIVCEV